MAVDVDRPDKAVRLVTLLCPFVGSFKIGLELIVAVLGSILEEVEETLSANLADVRNLFQLLGNKCFFDGKFHDIPNTVGAASRIVGDKMKVGMFNVHASGGVEAMRMAVAGKGQSQVLAVSVLTSLGENEAHLVYGAPSKVKVLGFARDALLAGCDGIICSPQELVFLDGWPELAALKKITPGIRSSNAPADDQRRTMTAREAIRAGAHALVIGRPITGAVSPVEAAQAIAVEVAKGLKERLHAVLFDQKHVKFGAFRLKLHETNPDAPLSPIYLNIRDLSPRLYELTGDVLHDLAADNGLLLDDGSADFDYVIGIPKAGEPIGQAFAKAVGRPHLRVEKITDEHDRHIGNKILDPFDGSGQKRVVLVDDLITKADTKREAIRAAEANGFKVVAVLVIYDREQGGLAELNSEGYKVCAAATLTSALDFFVQTERISEEVKKKVVDYIAAN